jgi:hypothetical protein
MANFRTLAGLTVLSLLATTAFATSPKISVADATKNGKGSVHLEQIFFSQNEIYQTFLGPQGAKISTGGSHVNNGLRVVGGPNSTADDKVMVLNNGSISGQEVSRSTFENQIVKAFNSRDLNWFFDSQVTDPHLRLDLDFAANPLQNKVIITERGIGGANSKFSLQALDSKGNPIGKVVNVDPKNRISTNIQLATYSSGNNPTFSGSQTMSFYTFDVAQFGVSQISSLRITTPNVHLSSGQDIQPDFKVFGSAAPVPEPGTMLALAAGAGLIAARRRRKA